MPTAFRQSLTRCLARLWSAVSGPRIVYGWQNVKGAYCPNTRVSTHTCFEQPEGIELGDHVFIGHFNRIDGSNGLVIEEGVQVTNYVSVLSHSSHRSVRVMGRRYAGHADPVGYVRRATHVGAYSFIGPHCIIAPGARIGKGVIVQAFSFISGEVPDFAIVGPKALGQPAVVMGDTRDMDAALLSQHPELQQAYAQWAGQDNLRKALAHAGSRGVVVGGRP
ncbi:MAG TPA: acyltransferase [Aquabacterium sp.]|mgnify:FL=1|jgi:acetyltransferase-like isoleucine patch superfamily enzyme|nr:acyltransferase [Aquabacterium sp.]HRH28883.1 acyltransferase [Aquabacterium sp.]